MIGLDWIGFTFGYGVSTALSRSAVNSLYCQTKSHVRRQSESHIAPEALVVVVSLDIALS